MPTPERERVRVMHERDEPPEIDVPPIERGRSIAIRVSRECEPVPAAGTIVDRPIERGELDKGLDHAKRGLDIRRGTRPAGRSRQSTACSCPCHCRSRDRGIPAFTPAYIALPDGWRDARGRFTLREVRLIVLDAAWPETVELLLRRVAPPRVNLHVRAVRPGVEILALRARKAQRSLGDEVTLQGGCCRRPEIEWHAEELVTRPAAKPGALADAADPRVNPRGGLSCELEKQVLVNLVEDRFIFVRRSGTSRIAFASRLARSCSSASLLPDPRRCRRSVRKARAWIWLKTATTAAVAPHVMADDRNLRPCDVQ